MTLAEALTYFDTHVTQVSQLEGFPPRVMIVVPNEAHEIMIAALEMQIPMKPIRRLKEGGNVPHFFCPMCDNYVWFWRIPKKMTVQYCNKCGQKIDWGVAE